jgi:hypothetical protein
MSGCGGQGTWCKHDEGVECKATLLHMHMDMNWAEYDRLCDCLPLAGFEAGNAAGSDKVLKRQPIQAAHSSKLAWCSAVVMSASSTSAAVVPWEALVSAFTAACSVGSCRPWGSCRPGRAGAAAAKCGTGGGAPSCS